MIGPVTGNDHDKFEQPHVTPKAGPLLSPALIDMTDGKTPTSKRSLKGFFKSRFERLRTASPSPLTTSPQPSALGQENPGKEMHSVPHAIIVSGVQLVNPGNGASAVTGQQRISRISFSRANRSFQDADHRTPTPIPRSQQSSSSSGPSVSAVVQGEQTSEHLRFIRLTDVCRSAQNRDSG